MIRMKVAVGFSLLVIVALFQNSSPTPTAHDSLPVLLQESAQFKAMIQSGKYQPTSVASIKSFKGLTDNLVSAATLSRTCGDLLKADPNLMAGTYTLYPSGSLKAPVTANCLGAGEITAIITSLLLEN